jgi:drug/metabolite transporter (DMT)-like permease
MNHDLGIAIIAGLGGMIGWGFADFFAKKTVDRLGEIKSLVWAHMFGALIFILATLSQFAITSHFISIPDTLGAWTGLAFFGVLQMVVYWLVYKAFTQGELVVINPVFASYSGLVALISIVALGEKPSGIVIGALILIFSGVILMNLDPEKLRSRRLKIIPGLKEAIAAAGLAAVWTLLWNGFISGKNALSFALFMYVFMTLAAYGLARLKRVRLSGVPRNSLRPLVLIGAGEALAYLSISYGFSRTTFTSVVALISGAFSLPAILLAYRFLGERLSRIQAVAVVITLIGIILVSIG